MVVQVEIHDVDTEESVSWRTPVQALSQLITANPVPQTLRFPVANIQYSLFLARYLLWRRRKQLIEEAQHE